MEMSKEQFEFLVRLSKMVQDLKKDFDEFKREKETIASNIPKDLMKPQTEINGVFQIDFSLKLSEEEAKIMSKSFAEAIVKTCEALKIKSLKVDYETKK